MARGWGWAMAALVVFIDQLSKYWITGPLDLPDRGEIELLPIFRLVWTGNHGVSGGFLVASSDAQRWLLTAATAGIAVAVAVWRWRERGRIEVLALGAILGGAIGNIADRVRLGYVADFLNLHFGAWSPFLVFNVADAAISIGVMVLIGCAVLLSRDHSLAEK
jgi:signal peptidase II